MRFWKEFIEKLNDIVYWTRNIYADLFIKLKSIDNKLTKEEIYIANENPIKKVNTSPLLLLEYNDDRNKLIIQNIGLEPCYIKLGDGISEDDFHFVLAPDTSPAFGNGGSVTLDNWHGEVYAIAEKETKISVLEY